VFYFVIIMT